MTTQAPTDPFSAFGVGRRPDSALAEMIQHLGPGLTDHRGLIDLPALAVLFDDIGGLPFYFAGQGSSVQARLSMSMSDRPAVDEVLEATAELVMDSGGFGATAVRITGDQGRPLCFGSARNVRVGREVVSDGDHTAIPEPTAPRGTAPPTPPSPGKSGREIVHAIAQAWETIGPLGQLLGGSVDFDEEDRVLFSSTTAPWMGNIMGTMHGGVIGAAVAQGLSLAAQAAAPGAGYQLIDFTVAFLRSPAVDGRTVQVHTRPIKVGRRLGVFAADLYDGDVLLASATADARFD
ncbi:PaaI family thioesterase [Gordonia caeni]|uniref:Acyl-CoA thioesterase-like N-terminal HotDog domain-containing protein n=1 Tax=Gordonia caeni TaxID=1007097 RepID=A0ABP7NQI2_9ACTN